MRLPWLKLLLLATFVYWATGAAKFVHEVTEHRGGDHAVDADGCDDDDGCGAAPVTASAPAGHGQLVHHGHPCPVCQMLAAMAVDRPDVVAVPAPSMDPIATVVVADRQSPFVRPAFTRLATGPPTA